MFNNVEIDNTYLTKADDTFIKCQQIHQDISNFELMLQKHGITTFYCNTVLLNKDKYRSYHLTWEKYKDTHYRLLFTEMNDGMKISSGIPLNEWDNKTKEEVAVCLPSFLEGLVNEIKGEQAHV